MFDHWTPGQEIVLKKKNPNYWDEGKPYFDEDRLAALLQPVDRAPQAAAGRDRRARRRHPGRRTSCTSRTIPSGRTTSTPSRWSPSATCSSTTPCRRSTTPRCARRSPGPSTATTWSSSRPARRRRCTSSIGRGDAGPRGGQGVLRLRPREGQVATWRRPALRTASRRCSTPTTSTRTRTSSQSVQADLGEIGIKADLKTMGNNCLLQPAEHAEHADHRGQLGWWMDFPDPSDWIGPLFSKASAVPGGMNSSFWWSAELEGREPARRRR